MSAETDIVGLLLAAGSSKRFGHNKLLHPLKNSTIGNLSAIHLKSAIASSFAVISENDCQLSTMFTHAGLEIIPHPNASQGMGSSIALGVKTTPQARGWIIALADMPFISPQIISQTANHLRNGAKICAPVYQGKRGHPVGFNHIFYQDLIQLNDDQGAREIINTFQNQLHLFKVEDPSVLTDIDTINDFQDILKTNN